MILLHIYNMNYSTVAEFALRIFEFRVVSHHTATVERKIEGIERESNDGAGVYETRQHALPPPTVKQTFSEGSLPQHKRAGWLHNEQLNTNVHKQTNKGCHNQKKKKKKHQALPPLPSRDLGERGKEDLQQNRRVEEQRGGDLRWRGESLLGPWQGSTF